MFVQNLRVSQSQNPYWFRKNRASVTFGSETVYEKNKFYEKDILTLNGPKYLYSNIQNPKQEILGATVKRVSANKIDILSRYQHTIGEIKYNPDENQPQINFQVGSFQPVIELKDDDLGITVLMTRGAKLSGKNLNINYKEITKPNISFGSNKLFVTTGYMPKKTKEVVDSYMSDKKFQSIPKSKYSSLLKSDYTIVGLAGGVGSRLAPISGLDNNSKPSTKYAGSQKTLLDISVLDTAATAGKIENYNYINDSEENLSGTAGIVIKGIKNGSISTDKPLVLLTGDTYNNIDLAKALYAFENDKNCGMAVVVKPIKEKDIFEKSLVKLRNDNNPDNDNYNSSKTAIIDDFSEKLNANNINKYSNYRSEPVKKLDNTGKLYTSTNILILHPEILSILEDYADADGKADFVEFLGFIFNLLNKPEESLTKKYPNGLKSDSLNLSSFTYSDGKPKPVISKDGNKLQLKAITAAGTNGQDVQWADVGTIEDYMSTIRQIANDKTNNGEFAKSVRNCVDSDNIIYMNNDSKSRLVQFKEKYGIDKIEGNIIVHSRPISRPVQTRPFQVAHDTKELFNLTKDQNSAQKFMQGLLSQPDKLKQKKDEMISKYGMNEFLKWYLAPNGYLDNYEKYVENFFNNAKSIDELLKFAPNWAPWKLEEKYWMLQHPSLIKSPEETKQAFYRDNDSKLAQPIVIGKLPDLFVCQNDFNKLISILKSTDCKNDKLNLNYTQYNVKRLKGGELNDKFIYLIERGNRKAILKFDRINVENSDTVNGRKLSIYEKRNIRKYKHIAPDSIFSNVCISKYLELNGCNNIPKMLYYDYNLNAALFEYIEDKENDKFQNGIIDEERDNIVEANDAVKHLNDLGIYLNDTASKNTLTDKNGVKKVIDLGHSNFIMPFKPGAKKYNFEFANTNGVDTENIYSSLIL